MAWLIDCDFVMIDLHKGLDKWFGKRLSFSVFFRIWLLVSLMMMAVVGMGFYTIQKTIRPSIKRVVEDTLADTSLVLAQVYQPLVVDYLSGKTDVFDDNVFDSNAMNNKGGVSSLKTPIFYNQKQHSQYHIYITDKAGKIIYDSHKLAQVGDDFSRWNDVYLTLRGKYGARSSDDDMGVSVMYVAAPIKHQGQLIGVVSTGKSVATLEPYIHLSEREIAKIIARITLLGVLLTTLIAWWLRHSIHRVNGYTKALTASIRPHFYLANELNELVDNIDEMKNAIENKAYVTEYVHTLTHELKSPLTAIRASSELLNDDLSPADRAMLCKVIGEQTDKMTVFIDKLLTLARLEQPDMKIDKSHVVLSACIFRLLEQLQSKITLHHCTIDNYIDKNISVYADPFWWSQALVNVLDNAIFYGQGMIAIDFYNNTLWVVNNSQPLPDYVVARAFERYFSQDSNALTQTALTQTAFGQTGGQSANLPITQKGTGLGLPLVQKVMLLHGGQASFHHVSKSHLSDNSPNLADLPNLSANLQQFIQKSPSEFFVLVGLSFTS